MQPQTPPNPPPGPEAAAPPSREAAISARVERLAREVEGLHASLEHAQRLASLGTIASIIAHEFNNILTPVMSYAQMALANPHDQQLLVKSAQRSFDGAEKASQIAAAILEFARDEFAALESTPAAPAPRAAGAPSESHGAALSSPEVRTGGGPARVDVQAAVQGALACLAREPAKDGIRLIIDVPERLFAAMRPVSLQQVLLNLILNARRAMAGARDGTLEIRARVYIGGGGDAARPEPPHDAVCASSTWNTPGSCSAPRAWITITVADTGCGMNPEQTARVFGAFVTGHGAPASVHRGTGLGLTVCQRLVEHAGGTLWCRSQVSSGTEFTIVIPGCD